MKINTFLLFCVSIIAFPSCDEDDNSLVNVSYLSGEYSNYTEEKEPNLDLLYNGQHAKDKSVVLQTQDDKCCNLTFVNILSKSDVMFEGVALKATDSGYACEGDTLINGQEIHFVATISATYDYKEEKKANALMKLDVKENSVSE